jgi:hypothetical protein
MIRTKRFAFFIAPFTVAIALFAVEPSHAQIMSRAQTGLAPVVYNWAGRGPAAARVMSAPRAVTPSVGSIPRLQIRLFRFELPMLTRQYWSRSSSSRR